MVQARVSGTTPNFCMLSKTVSARRAASGSLLRLMAESSEVKVMASGTICVVNSLSNTLKARFSVKLRSDLLDTMGEAK